MVESDAYADVTSRPLVDLTCSTDSASCIFATYVVMRENDQGRKNVFSVETACQIHLKSGSSVPTLAARKAGENLLSVTLQRVRSAHSRASSPLPGLLVNGKPRAAPSGPAVLPMSSVSRLRWTHVETEPNLPKAPLAAPPAEPLGDEDDIREYLEALSPGMGSFSTNLRAAGVDTVDTLLQLEDDELETLLELSAPLSSPPLSRREIHLLKTSLSRLLIGR